jgi:hypothetical protein
MRYRAAWLFVAASVVIAGCCAHSPQAGAQSEAAVVRELTARLSREQDSITPEAELELRAQLAAAFEVLRDRGALVGMSHDDVANLMGRPFVTWPDDMWVYRGRRPGRFYKVLFVNGHVESVGEGKIFDLEGGR